MSAVEAICVLGAWFVGWWLALRMFGPMRGSDLPRSRGGEPSTTALPARSVSSWSVVIPARNEEATIGALLDSLKVLRSSVADMQVLVVDDHSSDATASIV
ncbi:MAG: glycosyltransferase family 2 protein, partial [Acidimicrobiales bacterium]